MSSAIDLSLEDIIDRKRKEMRSRQFSNNKNKPQLPKSKLHMMDARLKIISKKRTQITDAREKLAEMAKQKDARQKIEQMRLKRSGGQPKQRNTAFQNHHKFKRTVHNQVFVDPSRHVVSQPLVNPKNYTRQIHANRFIENQYKVKESRRSDNMTRPKPILRTVENDIELIDDPMGEEFEPPKTSLLNRKASLQLKIVARNNDAWNSRSITLDRRSTPEKARSPPRPPSILKKRPMAALKNDKTEEKLEKPMEFRIIVSNLRNTVTAGDIEELFGDVGGMTESRLVRPGTAEVIYKTKEDAQKAVDLYHNRQLDGQPMNCLLVAPRSTVAATKGNAKPALYSTNSNVEPDISTFHKVLFSNL